MYSPRPRNLILALFLATMFGVHVPKKAQGTASHPVNPNPPGRTPLPAEFHKPAAELVHRRRRLVVTPPAPKGQGTPTISTDYPILSIAEILEHRDLPFDMAFGFCLLMEGFTQKDTTSGFKQRRVKD